MGLNKQRLAEFFLVIVSVIAVPVGVIIWLFATFQTREEAAAAVLSAAERIVHQDVKIDEVSQENEQLKNNLNLMKNDLQYIRGRIDAALGGK